VPRPPDKDTAAQATLTVDATPPLLALQSFTQGGFFPAGAVMKILWKMTEAHPDLGGLTFSHSTDGGATFDPVATGLDPTQGSYSWPLPKRPGARHKVRLDAVDLFGNSGRAESDVPFVIDDDLPSVVVLEKPGPTFRASRVVVRYKATDYTSGVDRVMLYGRPLIEGTKYSLLEVSRQPVGTIECRLPGEGAWGFLVVAADAAGRLSSEPDGTPPHDFATEFDASRPTISLRAFELAPGRKTWLNEKWEIEWTAEDKPAAADRLVVRIDVTSDGGRTWFAVEMRHPNTGKADMRKHLVSGKRYRVRVVAIDEGGNESFEATSEDFDPGELPAPQLSLLGLDEGRRYVAGTVVQLSWTSSDASLREVALEFSKDGGRTWEAGDPMHTPTVQYAVPSREGRYILRAVAKDAAGRPYSSRFVSFDVISPVEGVRLIVPKSPVEASKDVRLRLDPRHVVRTAKELVLEQSNDGQEWDKVADVKSSEFTFTAPAEPGEYLLRVVLTTPDGQVAPCDPAKLQVVERPSVTRLRMRNFHQGGIFQGGSGQMISLDTDARSEGIRVELSDAGGLEGSWKEVARSRLRPQSDGFHWYLPQLTGRSFRLRVSTPDLSDASSTDFAIDSKIPEARVTAPEGEAMIPVNLGVEVMPSVAPVVRLFLYVSRDGGKAWKDQGSFEHVADRGISFIPAEPGDYGLFLVAESSVGFRGPAPRPGTAPQSTVKARLKVDPPKGPLAFTKVPEKKIKGGDTVEVAWASEAVFGMATLVLDFDGKREEIQGGLPATGTHSWSVPQKNARECRLVLELEGASAESALFEIDSSPPGIGDVEIEVPKK
jgi:hypothetical protein